MFTGRKMELSFLEEKYKRGDGQMVSDFKNTLQQSLFTHYSYCHFSLIPNKRNPPGCDRFLL